MTHLRAVRIFQLSSVALALVLGAILVPWTTAEPAAAVDPAPSATPLLSTAGYDPGLPNALQGISTVGIVGACTGLVDEGQTCLGSLSQDSGTFHTVWAGPARLVLEWEPACQACRQVTVTVRDMDLRIAQATGESPMTLDLGSIPAGKYAIEVEFVGTVYGDVEQRVAWTAMWGGG